MRTEEFVSYVGLSDGADFVKSRADISRTEVVRQQTMHEVFYVPGENNRPGVYVKIAKPGRDGKPDKREFEIEETWYGLIRDELRFPNAPQAVSFELGDEDFALAVEEVPGKTYDEVFKEISPNKNIVTTSEFGELIERTVELSVRGYMLSQENPESAPVYFRGKDGGFDEDEFNFLTGRTLRILGETGFETSHLSRLLESTKDILTSPDRRVLYRDAIPLNWVQTNRGPVAIDLGSTSYKPAQFELIALLETPYSGLDSLSERQREHSIRKFHSLLKSQGASLEEEDEFVTNYALASVVKNSSGFASREDHIKNNKSDIESSSPEEAGLAEERLSANIDGRRFHIKRSLVALRRSRDFFAQRGLESELDKHIHMLEERLVA